MGWGFRKHIGVGPLRINFSKSGIGASVGVPGARVGINSRGQAYTQVGTHGVFYREQSSSLFNARSLSEALEQPPTAEHGTTYIGFLLPLRFATAVVQEIHALTGELSQPVELTDNGAVVRFNATFSMTIEVIPIEKGSEVRFFLWQHMPDGTTSLVNFASELGAEGRSAIEPLKDSFMRELGGQPIPVAPRSEVLSSYLQGQPAASNSKRALIVFVVLCAVAVWLAIMFSAASSSSAITPAPAPASPSSSVERQVSPTPMPRTRYVQQRSASSGGVQVRGYYRKDGTYVHPHTRRR